MMKQKNTDIEQTARNVFDHIDFECSGMISKCDLRRAVTTAAYALGIEPVSEAEVKSTLSKLNSQDKQCFDCEEFKQIMVSVLKLEL